MFQFLIDWSEVWAPMLALIIICICFKQPSFTKRLLIIYLIVALALNIPIDIKFNFKAHMPSWFQNNNWLYNTHSILRTYLFGYFFLQHRYLIKSVLLKTLLIIYTVFVIIDILFIESILNFSSRIFSAESLLMLTCCIFYFLKLIKDDDAKQAKKEPAVWVAVGLFIYEAATFFIFLFFTILMEMTPNFATDIWTIHNIAYVILCGFFVKAIYESRHK